MILPNAELITATYTNNKQQSIQTFMYLTDVCYTYFNKWPKTSFIVSLFDFGKAFIKSLNNRSRSLLTVIPEKRCDIILCVIIKIQLTVNVFAKREIQKSRLRSCTLVQ